MLVGYEMIIANSALRAWLAIYYLISNARGIIVKYIYSANKELYILYYTVIKQGLLRTQKKCRKHERQMSVFSSSSSVLKINVLSVLISQCNTWLRLLHLLYDIALSCDKT